MTRCCGHMFAAQNSSVFKSILFTIWFCIWWSQIQAFLLVKLFAITTVSSLWSRQKIEIATIVTENWGSHTKTMDSKKTDNWSFKSVLLLERENVNRKSGHNWSRPERMIGKRIDPDIDFDLVLDHVWVLKSQKGLKIANPVTQILLVTWTTQAALRTFSSEDAKTGFHV